jgi:DNA topoisomerase I
MQSAGSVRFRWPVKKVMDVAQKLYEDGFITYMRTDNPNLSDDAIAEVFAWGKANGKAMSAKPRHWKAKESAQEGHEAIRPKHFEHLDAGADSDQKALYQLIWMRAVASQMASAIFDVRTVLLESAEPLDQKAIRFVAKGEVLRVAGWKSLTAKDDTEEEKEEEEPSNPVPNLRAGASLTAKKGTVQKKKTRPPQRYTEGTLVADLESRGIGRPATYAATMDTLTKKSYIEIVEEGKGKTKRAVLFPTEIGMQVINTLRPSFSFMEYDFTSLMEDDLDRIAKGRSQYVDVVGKFYNIIVQETNTLSPATPSAKSYSSGADGNKAAGEAVICPDCGRSMHRIPRKDKSGYFFGCEGYKEGCKTTLTDNNGKPAAKASAPSVANQDGAEKIKCPDCGKEMKVRSGANGAFYGCSGFPKCRKTLPCK